MKPRLGEEKATGGSLESSEAPIEAEKIPEIAPNAVETPTQEEVAAVGTERLRFRLRK